MQLHIPDINVSLLGLETLAYLSPIYSRHIYVSSIETFITHYKLHQAARAQYQTFLAKFLKFFLIRIISHVCYVSAPLGGGH